MGESDSPNNVGVSECATDTVGGPASKEDDCSPTSAPVSSAVDVGGDDQHGDLNLDWNFGMITVLDVIAVLLMMVASLVIVCLTVPYISLD